MTHSITMSWLYIRILFCELECWVGRTDDFCGLVLLDVNIWCLSIIMLVLWGFKQLIFYNVWICSDWSLRNYWDAGTLWRCHNLFNFKFNRSLLLFKIRWITTPFSIMNNFPFSLRLRLIYRPLNIFFNIQVRIRFLLLQNTSYLRIICKTDSLSLLIDHDSVFVPAYVKNKVIFFVF